MVHAREPSQMSWERFPRRSHSNRDVRRGTQGVRAPRRCDREADPRELGRVWWRLYKPGLIQGAHCRQPVGKMKLLGTVGPIDEVAVRRGVLGVSVSVIETIVHVATDTNAGRSSLGMGDSPRLARRRCQTSRAGRVGGRSTDR